MIICICGMIGSGKTEYAKRCGNIVSDFDDLGSKKKQIQYTLSMEQTETVYHITSFPTPEEQSEFEKHDVKYIWINTGFRKCRENIIKRNRRRDVENLNETLKKNREIYRKYEYSHINFEVIDVFKNGEKW